MAIHILQGTLILTDRLAEHGQLVVEDGLIQEVVTGEPRYAATDDLGEGFIAPGYIDLHVHGIAGADVMDGTADSVEVMARRFAAHGVTGFLPSTLTASLETTRRAVAQLHESRAAQREGSRILGIHLEGPWISRQFKGVQNEAYILPPEEGTVRDLLAVGGGDVRRVSLAPEQPGADRIIRLLRDQGIYVSIAHTAATYEQVLAAIDRGATHVTHCFNAMTGLHHRAPGVAGAAMLSGDLYAELIADGIHIHPAVMQLLIRTKGRERVMVVTDAMSATELADGIYQLGGKEVFVGKGRASLADGTLASSTLTMDAGVRNLIRLCGVSLVDAVYMSSTTPAEAMGWGASLGKLRAGYQADLAILDTDLQPRATWIAGRPEPLLQPAGVNEHPR